LRGGYWCRFKFKEVANSFALEIGATNYLVQFLASSR